MPPEDTGEAVGHLPSRLTITFGFGPGLFERDGEDRFGLAAQRPGPSCARCRRCRPRRSTRRSLAASSASRHAPTIPRSPSTQFATWPGSGAARWCCKWSQLGFGRTSTTTRAQDTPRNLMGFKDGTNNIRAEDTADLEQFVWVGDEGAGVAARRQLRRRPPDPDADRESGTAPRCSSRSGRSAATRRPARRSAATMSSTLRICRPRAKGEPVIPATPTSG